MENSFLISEVLNLMRRAKIPFVSFTNDRRSSVIDIFHAYFPTVHKLLQTRVDLDFGPEGNKVVDKAMEHHYNAIGSDSAPLIHWDYRITCIPPSFKEDTTCHMNTMEYVLDSSPRIYLGWKNKHSNKWSRSFQNLRIGIPNEARYYILLSKGSAQMALWNKDSLFSNLPLEIKAIIIRFLVHSLMRWHEVLPLTKTLTSKLDEQSPRLQK